MVLEATPPLGLQPYRRPARLETHFTVEDSMSVRLFAWLMIGLGLLLPILGWQAASPAGFVGPALILLGILLLVTRRGR